MSSSAKMRWSESSTPTSRRTARSLRVVVRSAWDGRARPEMWLWARMAVVAF